MLGNELLIKVMRHLRKANIDYGKSVALNVGVPLEEAVAALEELERRGLIERVHGSAVKNTEAKFKLSSEVRKHHTYYRLTRCGEHLLRELERDPVQAYLESLGETDLKVLEVAEKVNVDHALTFAKLTGMSLEEVNRELERLVKLGLMEEDKSKVIKFGERKAKPKRETRTHHKYYRLSRLGELVVRRSRK
ncbi:hypothetical protein HS1genome_0564 [Sulfodiicoccus acidiphilus]|uniref:DUF2250 domain-containing protein n=1 Tax=Sulfodiicoccus acidiphilus TaxID=1670455 RepID=A0A348B1X3_9CREN|nr:hypothetical protein HS1genome_0564 [Sulfodiicoccus acidiphilus]GGT94454.1 hypothetical protein GCM10007116_10060 [Sulfodiicoccus acidiphilus]